MIDAADIRALRARLDETQDQFGARFGVSRFRVIGWERNGFAGSDDFERINRQFADLMGDNNASNPGPGLDAGTGRTP